MHVQFSAISWLTVVFAISLITKKLSLSSSLIFFSCVKEGKSRKSISLFLYAFVLCLLTNKHINSSFFRLYFFLLTLTFYQARLSSIRSWQLSAHPCRHCALTYSLFLQNLHQVAQSLAGSSKQERYRKSGQFQKQSNLCRLWMLF